MQTDLSCNAVAKTGGSVIGVTIGCLLGMLPLLWMDPEKREAERAKELLAEKTESEKAKESLAGKTESLTGKTAQ